MRRCVLFSAASLFLFAGCAAAPLPAPTASARALKPLSEQEIIRVKDWGGTPIDPQRAVPHVPTKITLHHQGEAYPPGRDPTEYLRTLQNWSRRTRMWSDIPYHYIVDLQGRVYEGRDIAFAGDTNTEYSPVGHALIEVVGNFDDVEPNQAQLDAVVRTMAMIAQKYRIAPENIAGHKDVSRQTACPGKNLYRYLENGYFRERVSAMLAP